ncbi:hypothetical protein B0H11DRAFT_1920658 [Mycena galericulata]|nr:hypothetical protein B0H11DRAFT_1920658 [Mycena galericulata]
MPSTTTTTRQNLRVSIHIIILCLAFLLGLSPTLLSGALYSQLISTSSPILLGTACLFLPPLQLVLCSATALFAEFPLLYEPIALVLVLYFTFAHIYRIKCGQPPHFLFLPTFFNVVSPVVYPAWSSVLVHRLARPGRVTDEVTVSTLVTKLMRAGGVLGAGAGGAGGGISSTAQKSPK